MPQAPVDTTPFVLWLLAICIGGCGFVGIENPNTPKWKRIAGYSWTVLWMGPPLVRIWIAMVTS